MCFFSYLSRLSLYSEDQIFIPSGASSHTDTTFLFPVFGFLYCTESKIFGLDSSFMYELRTYCPQKSMNNNFHFLLSGRSFNTSQLHKIKSQVVLVGFGETFPCFHVSPLSYLFTLKWFFLVKSQLLGLLFRPFFPPENHSIKHLIRDAIINGDWVPDVCLHVETVVKVVQLQLKCENLKYCVSIEF